MNREKKRIMILDDEQSTRQEIFEWQVGKGCIPDEIVLCGDRFEGLFNLGRYDYDLVISDIKFVRNKNFFNSFTQLGKDNLLMIMTWHGKKRYSNWLFGRVMIRPFFTDDLNIVQKDFLEKVKKYAPLP